MLARGQRGFTMIEIAVTLTVMALVLALGIPNFAGWLRNLQVRSAAEAMLNGIQLAKMEAVRRNTTVGVTFDGVSGWSIGCTASSTTCPATIQERSGGQGTPKARVATTNLTSGAALVFDGSGRVSSGLAVTTSPLLLDVTFDGMTCASSSGPIRCLRIVVTRFGQIRMCDPALTSTAASDARAC